MHTVQRYNKLCLLELNDAHPLLNLALPPYRQVLGWAENTGTLARLNLLIEAIKA